MSFASGSVDVPDYRGGSIVNLMASILAALGERGDAYPPLRALPPEALTGRTVVLLVVDGLGHDKLVASRPDGVLARHLAGRITSVFPSTTAAAVTTFLTGTAPQQHGVTGWFTYFREIGSVLAVLPFRPRHGGSAPAVTAGRLLGHTPVFDRLAAASHVVVPRHIAGSEFNTAHNGSARVHGFVGIEQMFSVITDIARADVVAAGSSVAAGRRAATVRAPERRRFVYAYWPELDRFAHEHGIRSREADAHLGRLDAAFGDFLGALAGTDTTVVVTADHGFIDAVPEQAVELDAHPRLAGTLLLPLCGERRAAYCYVQARRRAEFVDYVGTRLADACDLHDSAHLIEAGYFGLGPPHPRLGERVGDYTLLMKRAGIVKDWLLDERRHVQIGVHGGTSPEELYVPLIVARA